MQSTESSVNLKSINKTEWLIIGLLFAGMFFPPVTAAGKKIYPYDFIMLFAGLIATPAIILHFWYKNNTLPYGGRRIICFVILMTVIFFHGTLRPDLRGALAIVFSRSPDGSHFGPFDLLNDTIQFTRFLSWVLGWYGLGLLKTKPRLKVLGDAVGIFAIVETILALIFFFSPMRAIAGIIYGYDPDYFAWKSRLYGTLASPIELGALMSFSIIWWSWRLKYFQTNLKNKQSKKTYRLYLIFLICSIIGLIGANTATWIMSTVVGLLWIFRSFIYKRPWIIVPPFILFFIIAYIIASDLAFDLARKYSWFASINIENKFKNFIFRFRPWSIYIQSLASNWNSLILGFGFGRGHSDNSYIQIFRIGGISLSIFLLGSFLSIVYRSMPLIKDLKLKNSSTDVFWGIIFIMIVAAFTNDCLLMRVPSILIGLLLIGNKLDGQPANSYSSL